jgi:cellulose synthase/poly-beta-1,6-N-acetylglucosamine synthase-like glycosyltransferase
MVRWQGSWLFWLALLLGLFLAAYTPWRFWLEAAGARERGGAAASVAMALLAGFAAFTGLRWCLLLILSYSRTLAPAPRAIAARPFVSILMPACNEEAGIRSALEGLMALDYPEFEVIVVDDGSRDATAALARAYEGRHATARGWCEIRVIAKANGGKWSAHNVGLRHARGALVLCIDADSRLEPPSLARLVGRLDDPRVGAVAGQIRVRNRDNLVTRLQALEYVLANGTFRFAQAASGAVMIVPGPIGLFRRDVLEQVQTECPPGRPPHHPEWAGPFSEETFAEVGLSSASSSTA